MTTEYNTLQYYFSQEGRFHNPHTVAFVDMNGNTISEQSAKEQFEEFPNDTEVYIEITVIEKFGMICSISGETIEPDVGYPTDYIEFVETLQHQGWCKTSAKDFARAHIDDELIFDQASQHLLELMDIGDQDFPSCEEDIAYKYNLSQDDMLKVKALFDEEDALRCLQM